MSNKFERMMLIKKPNGYHPIFTSLSKDGHVLMSIITMSISNVIELFSRTFAAVMVILIECANEMYYQMPAMPRQTHGLHQFYTSKTLATKHQNPMFPMTKFIFKRENADRNN